MDAGESQGVRIKEVCIPCNGEGKLGRWQGSETNPCPWCNGSGKVSEEVNNTFLRVFEKVPSVMRATKVFGTRDLHENVMARFNMRMAAVKVEKL